MRAVASRSTTSVLAFASPLMLFSIRDSSGGPTRWSPSRSSTSTCSWLVPIESDASVTGAARWLERHVVRPILQGRRPDTVTRDSSGTDTVSYDANGMPVVSSGVTVVANLPMLSASTEAGKVTLEPEQVTALPSLGSSDIFRALQWLPGVSSNETSSGLFVRGGTPDQNLVDFDGFTVYSVNHLFGYFSAFNMDAIDAVDLSKGAYEARYGGRLASLTEIRAKSQPPRIQGMVGASVLSVDGVFQLPVGSKASVLVAHRRSFQSPLYDRILGLVSTGTGQAPPGRAGNSRRSSILNRSLVSTIRTGDSNGDRPIAISLLSARISDTTTSTTRENCSCRHSSWSKSRPGAFRSPVISRSPMSANTGTPDSARDGTVSGAACSGRR